MKILSAVLWILGIGAVLTGICFFSIQRGKDRNYKAFDERQQIAQGDGYKVSFWVGAIYYVFVMLAFIRLEDGGELPVAPFLLVYFGFMMQIGTLHIHGILTHSELPLGEKPIPTIIGYFFCSLVNLWGFWMNYKRYPGLELKGHGVIVWLFLVNCVMFMLLALAHTLTLLWKEREDG